jgi:hypothetical protein
MSRDWFKDMQNMHIHYSVPNTVASFDKEKLKTFLKFRVAFLDEELTELKDASDAEDVVDALIDLCVVAIGTLEAFGVDAYAAWDEVLKANMAKQEGIKASRPNPLGLPDLIKPEGWRGPSHAGNHGRLTEVFDVE